MGPPGLSFPWPPMGLLTPPGLGWGACPYLVGAMSESVSTRGPGQACLTTAKDKGLLAGSPGQPASAVPPLYQIGPGHSPHMDTPNPEPSPWTLRFGDSQE